MQKNVFLAISLMSMIFLFGCVQVTEQAQTQTQPRDNSIQVVDNGQEVQEQPTQAPQLEQLANNYYRFDKAHYEQSLAEGKTIFLDFHADWCPICNRERPHIFSAFNKLDDPSVVGYEVHFNDGNTNAEDKAAIVKYGITLQHTKVVVDSNGEVSSKSLEGFTEQKVFDVIAAAQSN